MKTLCVLCAAVIADGPPEPVSPCCAACQLRIEGAFISDVERRIEEVARERRAS